LADSAPRRKRRVQQRIELGDQVLDLVGFYNPAAAFEL